MSNLLYVDYSTARPDPKNIAAATNSQGEHYSGVIRYVPTGFPKDVTETEIAELHAAGLDVMFVYETTAQRSVAGSAAGMEDGNICRSELEKLNVPIHTPVLVNIGDWAVTTDELNAIEGYYYQFRLALGETYAMGGYATGWLINELQPKFPHDLWWQNAIDDNGVPGNVVVKGASMYQRTQPTIQIPGSSFKDYDENVAGFGPVPDPPSWEAKPDTAPAPAPVPSAPKDITSVTVKYSDGTETVLT